MEEPEVTETIELPEQDKADLHRLYNEPDGVDEEPSFHPILQIWREVLAPAKNELDQKVTPQWANRICAEYSHLKFSDMNEYRDRYFGKLLMLADILDQEIASDSDSLTWPTPEEDAEENAHHYKNLLMVWQLQFLQWELEWDCMDRAAGVELASISEIHKMFFGATGITAFLDNIGFEFTEDDQQTLVEALEELRGGAGE